MIYFVPNHNLKRSVEFLSEILKIRVVESASGIFLAQTDAPIQVWLMMEIMRRNFSENHQREVPITENQLETMGMMSQISEQVGMENLVVPDSRYVA